MGFKDSLLNDIERVFFNLDEFAESCSWNKRNIVAIIDDESLIRKYSSEFEVLTQGSHLIYVDKSQLEDDQNIGDVVVFNNNLYTINEIKEENGILSIFLNAGRG